MSAQAASCRLYASVEMVCWTMPRMSASHTRVEGRALTTGGGHSDYISGSSKASPDNFSSGRKINTHISIPNHGKAIAHLGHLFRHHRRLHCSRSTLHAGSDTFLKGIINRRSSAGLGKSLPLSPFSPFPDPTLNHGLSSPVAMVPHGRPTAWYTGSTRQVYSRVTASRTQAN